MTGQLYVVRIYPPYRYTSEYFDREWEMTDPGIIAAFSRQEDAERYARNTIPPDLNPFQILYQSGDAFQYYSCFADDPSEEEGTPRTAWEKHFRSLGLTPPQGTKTTDWADVYRQWWKDNQHRLTPAQKLSLWQFVARPAYEVVPVPLEAT